MSTNTQAAHFLYTTNEWISEKHQSNLDINFKVVNLNSDVLLINNNLSFIEKYYS